MIKAVNMFEALLRGLDSINQDKRQSIVRRAIDPRNRADASRQMADYVSPKSLN